MQKALIQDGCLLHFYSLVPHFNLWRFLCVTWHASTYSCADVSWVADVVGLALVFVRCAVCYWLVESHGSTFMTRELDEMHIKTQNLVHQIGVEDGTVLAVAQRIIERLLEVEVLLALKLLIVCGVWETLLYESQDSVGSILFVQTCSVRKKRLKNVGSRQRRWRFR